MNKIKLLKLKRELMKLPIESDLHLRRKILFDGYLMKQPKTN